MKKKSHAEIQSILSDEGYQLLCKYENAHHKMQVRCPSGHEVLITWSAFNRGSRCPECAKVTRANKRRTPEHIVRKAFQDAGYELLIDHYRDNLTRMDCLCPQGHKIKVDWASFKNGTRCNECAKAVRVLTRKKQVASKARAAFEAEGYQLLDEYLDSHSPMRFICPQGHAHQMSWTNFDTGHRCIYCTSNAPVTQLRVQKSFEAEGYQLLDQYSHKKRRLRFLCPNGHKYSISWDNWNSGSRCAICLGRFVTQKQVRDAFELEGYSLLTQYQRKNTQKLYFICPQGHHHCITWADFQAGCRCAKCNKPTVDPNFVNEFFIAAGYQPITRYEKSTEKISYICPLGHQYAVIWHSFKNGSRCPECAGKVIKHEDIEFAFAADGYELLDKYKNSHTKMRYLCPEGHQHSITWDAFKQGTRCPYCAGMKPSKEQLEINAIKKNIAGLIYIYLKKQEAQKPFSLTSFSSNIAELIHSKLGNRPPNHHLDHIVPQSFFDFRKKEEIEACWDIENLRWLVARKNMSKGHRLKYEDVEKFSLKQLHILATASRRPRKFDPFLICRGIITE